MQFKRVLNIPKNIDKSFFLWGPRQAGKTFYLKNTFKNETYID